MELTKEHEEFIIEQVKAGAKPGQKKFSLSIGTYLELKFLKESESKDGSKSKNDDRDANKPTGSNVDKVGSKKSDSKAGN